ncbi:hypothetical protein ACFL2U_00735 [Patescibacteria group bacterium]
MKTNHYLGARQRQPIVDILPEPIKRHYMSYFEKLNSIPKRLKKLLLFKSSLNLISTSNLQNPFGMVAKIVQRNWMLRPVAHCSLGALSA